MRFCINLRRLNARTIKDAHSIPQIEETLDCLNGAEWFTFLDLYWQVEMEEDSKALTAFTVRPLDFYECDRVPIRLINAPATFQCLMQNCLGNLHLQYCIMYLNDIIVFSKTPEEHLARLQAIFEKLMKAELKLKPSKYEFFKQELTYLGHVVSKMVYKLIPRRLRQSVNGLYQPMSLKCEASLGLPITTIDSSRNMHRWPNPYTN